MRILIVGCGYIGCPLGAGLVQAGHEVFGVRRHPEAAAELSAAGIQPLTADITRPEDLTQLPGPFDWVVNTAAAASGGGVQGYRSTYLEGTRNLIEWLANASVKKYVYTSSTGVYGQTDGSLVKETHPTEPGTETGKVLVETEQLLMAAVRERKFPAVVLRVAGIYGPGRGYYLQQYLRNEARIPGRGERFVNMIHQDDVVGAIAAALKNGRPGEIYNVADNEPVALVHLYRWLSETLGKWMPPFVDEPAAGAESRRGVTNKRVQNRRLTMELGYALKFPSFRQGYTAEIRRLDEAGELDVQPEPR